MNKKDGLSQEDRVKRISMLRYPLPLDNTFNALHKRSLLIASYLKFFSGNDSEISEDYFETLLKSVFTKNNSGRVLIDGAMEPSGAVLYNFLENLHRTTETFNTRWKDLPKWYLQNFIGVKSHPLIGDKVWVSFKNSGEIPFIIPRETGFKVDYQNDITKYYRLAEDVEVHSSFINKLYLLEFQKQRKENEKMFPLLKAINLRELYIHNDQIISEKEITAQTGIRITSPVLVLNEGVRKITIHCFPFAADSMEIFNEMAMNSIFKISISTENGWENIKEYAIWKMDEKLIIEFTLPDYFSSTTECTIEKHNYLSPYPAVNLYLNLDASDVQKSKIEYFQISKVKVAVSVRKITNIKVYNELGKVDNSKPFAPFGINTEKGAWFTLGNYEINIKNTKNIYVNFYWAQLPEHPGGLVDHYSEYERNIENSSFELEVRYLSDFQWRKVSGRHEFSLFNSVKDTNQLRDMTIIGPVDVEKMPLIHEDQKEYDYSLNARNGFLNFKLINPEIGFGEQLYRKLFTEQMMKNARKKQKYPTIKPPLQPILKRITIDYEAEDTIDQRTSSEVDTSRIQLIMPLEELAVTSPSQNDLIKFVPQIEEYNLLMAINNIVENNALSIFFDVYPLENDDLYRSSVREQRELLRDIRIYIGNPVYWQKMPLSFIVKDETMALLMSGCIQFQFPQFLSKDLYDDQGLIWIRIGFENTEAIRFPQIRSIYTNAGLLEMKIPDSSDRTLVVLNSDKGEITEETLVPGLGQIIRISEFYDGVAEETPDELLVRMAEYTSHKGRAVTIRDYERLVLQAFPDIAKVKCWVGKNKKRTHNTIYLIVLPQSKNKQTFKKPLTPPHLIYFIQKYMSSLTSAYVREIKVINPVYEEVIIRCKFQHKGYFSLKRKKLLEQKINECIAPWQYNDKLPVIGFAVNLKKMHDDLVNEFTDEILFSDFSAIYISKVKKNFSTKEFFYKKAGYECEDYLIKPLVFNSILIPAGDHLILSETDYIESFGINEMTIGKSFIIPKN